jgi:hypothetical protein
LIEENSIQNDTTQAQPLPMTGKNWLATVPGKGYFAVLRLYGPTEPALTKTWKPGDVTKMK